MSRFRVPYPEDPEQRRAVYLQAAAALGHLGSHRGTPEEGTFEGATPLGSFAGSYRALNGSGELEIVLTRKPWLVGSHLIERELRKYLAKVEMETAHLTGRGGNHHVDHE